MKHLTGEEGEYKKADLEVIECDCGYHLGIDGSYLVQVGDFSTVCPSCGKIINTSIIA